MVPSFPGRSNCPECCSFARLDFRILRNAILEIVFYGMHKRCHGPPAAQDDDDDFMKAWLWPLLFVESYIGRYLPISGASKNLASAMFVYFQGSQDEPLFVSECSILAVSCFTISRRGRK